MSSDDDLVDVIEEQVPYDGPHSRESVIGAAQGVAHLVRYLNNATQPGTARYTLEWASTIDSVLGTMKGALYGMDQLFEQLSAAAAAAAEDPTVYDARAAQREDRHPDGARVARELAETLNGVRQHLAVWQGFRVVGGMAAELERAHSLSARLGNERSDD
ncbi:hypothetical protein [Prauserella endophytica]|uniref:Uncharacterized protein n=1 Tax=Prauserella endophytica TaxID=1592324 RepID=A0ABY2RUV1_9PSEU|nr:hypothetical protein [Prauserella endophytica]TKG61503.1 hypothetical protein FCN18_33220 [Prauserella endophytica]